MKLLQPWFFAVVLGLTPTLQAQTFSNLPKAIWQKIAIDFLFNRDENRLKATNHFFHSDILTDICVLDFYSTNVEKLAAKLSAHFLHACNTQNQPFSSEDYATYHAEIKKLHTDLTNALRFTRSIRFCNQTGRISHHSQNMYDSILRVCQDTQTENSTIDPKFLFNKKLLQELLTIVTMLYCSAAHTQKLFFDTFSDTYLIMAHAIINHRLEKGEAPYHFNKHTMLNFNNLITLELNDYAIFNLDQRDVNNANRINQCSRAIPDIIREYSHLITLKVPCFTLIIPLINNGLPTHLKTLFCWQYDANIPTIPSTDQEAIAKYVYKIFTSSPQLMIIRITNQKAQKYERATILNTDSTIQEE